MNIVLIVTLIVLIKVALKEHVIVVVLIYQIIRKAIIYVKVVGRIDILTTIHFMMKLFMILRFLIQEISMMTSGDTIMFGESFPIVAIKVGIN